MRQSGLAGWRVGVILGAALGLAGCATQGRTDELAGLEAREVFVSADGRGDGSRRRPVGSIERAVEIVRNRRRVGENPLAGATVWLRGGRYPIDRTMELGNEDSRVTLAAWPGERVVLSAAHVVSGWERAEANGRAAWVARVPAEWGAVRMVSVNGEYVARPRLPRLHGDGSADVFRLERAESVATNADGSTICDTFKGGDSFVAREGDVKPFRNLRDVEAVVLHFWIEERMPIESFDSATRKVVSTRKTQMSLADDHTGKWGRYYLENVFEGMTEPGDWYFDRAERRLYYLPREGETVANTRVEVNGIDQLIRVNGATGVVLRGLTLTGSGWHHPSEALEGKDAKEKPPAGMTQTAATLPAAVTFTKSRFCRVEDCEISNVGLHAIELAEGCEENRIVGNHIHHTGGGGLKIGGAAAGGPAEEQTHDNVVSDNHIHHIGRVFHSAAAILVQNAYGMTIAHNHVHDGYQMAIPVGWSWGYGPNVAHDNRIEYNHIHHFGQGWLSDIGGIYTLGVQPGTVVRNNVVHDIYAATYGGWCIYPDEGSSGILIENNVAYDTSNNAFHQHYGKENVVRNNVFAFGRAATFEITRPEAHVSLMMERNILVSEGAPIYGSAIDGGHPKFVSDHNLLFSLKENPPRMTGSMDWEAWRKGGHDEHSVVGDPGFVDPKGRDFSLKVGAAALQMGFRPIDTSTVGPRADRSKGG